ncbi:germination protein [Alicyclobacillus acidoterrestris]|uniref:GerAB/ArcD/ProY family transporter n=1 Tax=Alicyclobacillus suci TaxID=2816080 RepID=UPI001193375B|nr:endospore germination permease [Alicyclobacillus suci]GEO26106.1 germination protein [Alicyclobacillus acidoterrestris]
MTAGRMRISGRQIFWIIVCAETSPMESVLLTPLFQAAKQDAWISMAIGGLAGLLITFLIVRTSLLYPKQTIVEYAQTILGKWIGKLLVIPYLVMALLGLGVILRQFGDFIHMALFELTPLWAVIVGFLLMCVYLTYAGGIEGIGRSAEIIGPIVIFAVLLVKVLNFSSLDIHLVRPIYWDSGWRQILLGSLATMSFVGESVIMLVLVPFVSQPNRCMSYAMWGQTVSFVLVTGSVFLVTSIFGPNLAGRLLYPAFEMAGFISIADFLQNVESVVVVIWIFGYFIEVSVFLFVTCYSLGQWFHVKDWRKTIWPVAVILFILAVIPKTLSTATIEAPKTKWTLIGIFINIVIIPLLIYIVGYCQRKFKTSVKMS